MVAPHRKGFTLIELLVVISIMGLLSSVVLSAVNTARTKADNTQRNQIAEEYRKALMLHYDTYDGYPYPASGSTGAIYCLGDYVNVGTYSDTGACGNRLVSVSGSFIIPEDSGVLVGPFGTTGVKQFLPTLPVMKDVPWVSGVNSYIYKGPAYSCTAQSGGRCTKATMRWALQGAGQSCIKGILPSFASNRTFCILSLD